MQFALRDSVHELSTVVSAEYRGDVGTLLVVRSAGPRDLYYERCDLTDSANARAVVPVYTLSRTETQTIHVHTQKSFPPHYVTGLRCGHSKTGDLYPGFYRSTVIQTRRTSVLVIIYSTQPIASSEY